MEGQTELLDRSGSAQISRVVIGKLRIGADLLEGIRELVRKEGIRSGVILSGIGPAGHPGRGATDPGRAPS